MECVFQPGDRETTEDAQGAPQLHPPLPAYPLLLWAPGFTLLVAGVVLLIFGIQASESFASDVSETFTGSPTDRAIWMIVGGVAAAALPEWGPSIWNISAVASRGRGS